MYASAQNEYCLYMKFFFFLTFLHDLSLLRKSKVDALLKERFFYNLSFSKSMIWLKNCKALWTVWKLYNPTTDNYKNRHGSSI